MMRLPRFLPSVVIACSSVALPLCSPVSLLAQDEPTTKPAESSLKGDVDAFWHYAKTFRYDLAAGQATKILEAKPQPVDLLKAFEAVAADRKDNLDQWLLRWQDIPQLREPMNQVIAILAEGHRQQRADQSIIDANIKRLIVSDQAYSIAIERLRDSGELAIPMMLDYLRDPARSQYHGAIRQALIDMGQAALAPLVAALDMPINERNEGMLLYIVGALGNIGYDVAIPPLVNIAKGANAPAGLKAAATTALQKMGAANALDQAPVELFYQIALKDYYNKSAITDRTGANLSFLWMWDETKGLVKQDVPTPIFGYLLAKRDSRKALQLDASREDVLALWLAADYGSEVHLPNGAQDPTRSADTPNAHYYGVASGAKYLNMVLARALDDRDTAIALASVKSLKQIGGESTLFAPQQTTVLVNAMKYPDRTVRFEAAFAAASALPQTKFDGQDRVVPTLAEAVVQTGKPYILVMLPEEQLNGEVQALKDAGYNAAGATTAEAAVATGLPAVDVILASDESASEVDKLQRLASQTPRLQGAVLLVITKTQASPFAIRAASDPLLSVTQATKGDELKAAIEDARKKAGSLPLDEKLAADYALKATQLLADLAISRGQVLDLSAAQSALLLALEDTRPEVAKASGRALALMNSRPAQQSLLARASDTKLDAPMRISMYGSLATSAKFFGNLLEEQDVKTLQNAVVQEPALDVRAAAAEAHGALNLSPAQVKSVLLGSK